MEHALIKGNSRKLFQPIRATGKKGLDFSGTNREFDDLLIQNLQQRAVRWVDHLKTQFIGSSAWAPPAAISASIQWLDMKDPPDGEEILRKSEPWDSISRRAPRAFSALFKDEGTELVREIQLFFSTICCAERVR